MLKLVMFDMDGTLVDSRADLANALNLMLADYQLPALTLDETAALLGDGRHVFVRLALNSKGGAHVDIDDAVARMSRYYDSDMVSRTTLYNGMTEVLDELKKQNVKLGVISNKQQDAARTIVDHLGLAEVIDLTLGDDGSTPLKPAPDMLLNMMAHFKVGSPDDCWMIGDNHTDIGAAKNAGVRSCFCNYGFGMPDGVKPDAQVESPREILQLSFY